jgi:O-antigen ligase
MDPHNLILEFVLRYGLVGLTVVCAVWVFVVVEGLSARKPRHWMVPTLTALVATIPILGVVPSTILPYGFVQLTIAALAAVLAHERQVGLSVRPAPTLAVDQPTNRATQKL